MEILASKDGPIRKFYLIKEFGVRLRALGYDPQKMSCQELDAAIAKALINAERV